MKRKIIIGNWKMNQSLQAVDGFVAKFSDYLGTKTFNFDFALAPSFIHLHKLVPLKSKGMILCAQDAYFVDYGAFTGCVSYQQLRDYGVDYVIVGHSERRHILHENDTDINQKVLALTKAGMVPVVCVGETRQQFNDKLTDGVITNQITLALESLALGQNSPEIIIAYEPVWAIGTKQIATTEIIKNVTQVIQNVLVKLFGKNTVDNKFRILYGGSVNETNIKELLAIDTIDGVLVGNASLDPDKFIKLTEQML